jgi:hypothetical protein
MLTVVIGVSYMEITFKVISKSLIKRHASYKELYAGGCVEGFNGD